MVQRMIAKNDGFIKMPIPPNFGRQVKIIVLLVTYKILRLNEKYSVRNYYNFAHKQNHPFIPGKSRINYAGRVYDEKEMINLWNNNQFLVSSFKFLL